MTRASLLATICAAALAYAAPGAAAPAAMTGGGSATIVSPLSVVKTADLDFGTLVAGATSGSVTINPTSGVRSVAGGTSAAGGSPQPATFVANGVINRVYIVSLPAGATLSNGAGSTMAITNFILDGPTLQLFGTGGIATVKVGGVLAVGANQVPGDYAGTFTVTLIYL